MSRLLDPEITAAIVKQDFEALARLYRQCVRGVEARDAVVDALLLRHDRGLLESHQAGRERTGQLPLDITSPDAVALAVHRAHERPQKQGRCLPLEAASPTSAHADDDDATDAPATPEVHDRDGLTPEAALIVEEHVAGIVHAAQALCDAVDAAAVELSQGRRRGSGMRRIRRALKRSGGRPRGAGPGTPVDALRALLRAGVRS